MTNVSQLPTLDERKAKRRLHLREVSQNAEPATSVGATLRLARLERGEELPAMASALKLRRDQLEAIEEDDLSRLPGRTYALGFVRSYARHLGLDADALVEQFKDENADQDVDKPVNLVFPEAAEEKRLPNGSILILALVIAMVIYGISYLTLPRSTTAASAKAEENAVVVDPAQAPKPAPAVTVVPQPVSVVAPVATPVTQPVAVPLAQATPVPPPSAAPVSFVVGALNLPDQALPASMTQTAAPATTFEPAIAPSTSSVVAQADTAATAPAPAPVATATRISLKALEPTYIRMRDPRAHGTKGIVIDRVLKAGESFDVPDRAGLLMQTGNAGGLQVTVDGRVIGVLGKSGEVVTRIPVDPSYFLERLSAAQ